MDNLQGKTVVITGAANGIGAAMAKVFAGAGAHLVLADVDETGLDAVRTAITNTEVLTANTDVTRAEQLDNLRDSALAHFGTVDVLINNAGVACANLVWEQPRAEWDWIFDVNVMGVVNGIRAFVPLMIAQGHGHVLNTASMAGLMTSPTLSAYSVSKHAVVAMSECLRHDLALIEAPVNVSVLCPGPVATRIHEERGRPAMAQPANPIVNAVTDAIAAQMPEGKSAEETAEAALRAVLRNEFWVLPDPTHLPGVAARFEEIQQQADI